jgi:thiol-disulfide isomerase/thioredoxin
MSLVSNGDQEKMLKSAKPAAAPKLALPVLGPFPSLAGAEAWLNSPPLNAAALKGKVVLIDFWTYSCINCLRAIPYVRAWWAKYKDEGLMVIGVHSPEFAFEHDIANVKKAVANLKITYPVAIDNDFTIWRAFDNEYWPAHYFIDAEGRIRHEHFGEGDYSESERVIQQLLAEAGNKVTRGLVAVNASGAEAAADTGADKSPETYIGYFRADNFASPGGEIHDAPHDYVAPKTALNEWGLTGDWTVGMQHAALNEKDGSIVYRFHARDLHLVLGPAKDDKPVHFRVTLDGAPPGESHGSDIDAAGNGVVTGQRLYQLIRQSGPIIDRTFEIQFLDPGVEAYAFTFG